MTIHFTCPHCGKQTIVDDKYAGTSGPCAGCGQTITMPGGANPYGQMETTSYEGGPSPMGPPPKRGGFPAWAILLIVGAMMVPCMGFLAALLLPAVQAAREAANRVACKNNLRQIELAIQNYHDQHGDLPPSSITDEDGRPLHSWRVLLLPYFYDPELQQLYDEYDFSEPWDGPHNRRLAERMPDLYRCPSHPPQDNDTDYMVVVGEFTPLQPAVLKPGQDPKSIRSKTSMGSVVDGAAITIGVVEVAHSGVNWLEPSDLSFDDATRGINFSTSGDCISSLHPGGAHVGFLDGSVKFLPNDTSKEKLRAMIDRRDGVPLW
jgi:prepilin-type processing-associated H-X9-DG protein